MALALLSLGLASPGCVPDESDGLTRMTEELASIVATCAATEGQPEAMRVGLSFWESFEQGATFRAGDWVRTGALSSARLEFLAGGRLELGEHTVVLVEPPPRHESGAGAVVALEAGALQGSLPEPLSSNPPPLLVRAQPDLLVALRAGDTGGSVEFRLARTPPGLKLSVTKGRLELVAGGRRRTLDAGFGVDLAHGLDAPPQAAAAFPPSLSPGVDARFQWAPDLLIRLAWQPQQDVPEYQVQVATDLGFRHRLVDTSTRKPAHTFIPSEPGLYVWRVASKDARGQVGEYGFARRLYVERRSRPELLVAPGDGHELLERADAPLTFVWRSSGNAPVYQLVIARDRQLRDAVVTQRTALQQVQVGAPSPGTYYWGVYADADPRVPLFTQARKLVVLPPPRERLARTSPP